MYLINSKQEQLESSSRNQSNLQKSLENLSQSGQTVDQNKIELLQKEKEIAEKARKILEEKVCIDDIKHSILSAVGFRRSIRGCER